MKKEVKRILFLFLMIMCGMIANAQNQSQSYVIQSGETLYSIARKNGLTVEDVLNANKGLTENIMAGQTIQIPAASSNPQIKKLNPCKTTHVVQKKETVYGISHQYGITEEELLMANPQIGTKLKKGMELCIPHSKEEKQVHQQQQQQVLETIETKRKESLVKHYDVIKIAVIAPFALNEVRRSQEAQKITDFYKGFLMAVDTLRHQGVSCDIYAYEETGNDGSSISNILNQPMLKHVDMIVGPFRPANASKVAAFASENKILMVTPMSTKTYDLTAYKNLYQVSAPQSYVYQKVVNKFVGTFSAQNIIFIGMNDSKDNIALNNQMKKELEKHGVAYKNLNIDDMSTFKDILSLEKTNLIVPSSGSEKALNTICQKLRSLGSAIDDYKINLFGYPEWQTYTNQKSKLQKYNAVFYTTFFANPSSSNVSRFNTNFTRWFRREQVKSYPSYGLLGFDIGQYFVRSLHEKGSSFEPNNAANYTGLQTQFSFERKNESGAALNNSLFFVRVNSDGSFSVK